MKKVICWLLYLLLLPALLVTVHGEEPKIVDMAGLLSQQEEESLEEVARKLVQLYDIDVVILTVESLQGNDPQDYADDYFDYNGYGIGDDFSGVLLMLSLEYRDWAISTTGKGIYALTDYGIQKVFTAISGQLAKDNYFEAFDIYLDELDAYFQAYSQGSPIDGPSFPYDGPGSYIPGDSEDVVFEDEPLGVEDIAAMLGGSLLVGTAAGGIGIWIMRRGMNTARAQSGATSYIAGGGLKLSSHRDYFLYSNVRKVRRSDDSSGGGRSGGGGSRVHRSSSGRIHGGGRGKF